MERRKYLSFFPNNETNVDASNIFSLLSGGDPNENTRYVILFISHIFTYDLCLVLVIREVESNEQNGEGEDNSQSRNESEKILKIEEAFANAAPYGDPEMVKPN